MSFNLKHPNLINNIDTNAKSILVFIGSQSSNPFIDLNDPIEASAGIKTNIRLDKSVFNKYPKPYSDCNQIDYSNAYYYNQIIKTGYEYSHSLCLSLCQIDKLGNNCTLRVSSIDLNKYCPISNLTIDNLSKIYQDNFENKEINDICSKLCPIECTTEYYQVFTSNIQLDHDIHYGNRTYIINDLVSLSIHYHSLNYLNYVESPTVSTFDLVSNIGGIVGLLLGNYSILLLNYIES